MDYLNNPDCSENKNIFLFKNCSYCSESGKMDKLKGPEHSMLKKILTIIPIYIVWVLLILYICSP